MNNKYPFNKEYGETVSPGHPDKLADAIADEIVSVPVEFYEKSLVGVEVAVALNQVFLTGRIATKRPFNVWSAKHYFENKPELNEIVRYVYRKAGYSKKWTPDPKELIINTDGLIQDSLHEGEENIRKLSDDQSITVGYAVNSPETGFIPRGQWLSRAIMKELMNTTKDMDDFGPDAKVMTEISTNRTGWKLDKLVCSIQHSPDIYWEDIGKTIREVLERVSATVAPSNCEIDPWNVELIANGHGDFTNGGPIGDNGLSGKKLVVDAYGPMVPIGGGAFSGKDPHKVDRIGPLLAREIALKSLIKNNLSHETVWLTWAPGEQSYISIRSASGLAEKLSGLFPNTINECFDRYFKDRLNTLKRLPNLAIHGWFGTQKGLPWEKLK
jgi:S-adenosylmethionine synthetase|tara:strand:+ start:1210 stop:2361 length:1152 start_codon:yes stop_codon:yes gene_type:complete